MNDRHFVDDKQHPDYDPDNPCRTCIHWKWHSRKQEVESMHSVGFHYCEMIKTEWKKSVRLIICAAHEYYKRKNND